MIVLINAPRLAAKHTEGKNLRSDNSGRALLSATMPVNPPVPTSPLLVTGHHGGLLSLVAVRKLRSLSLLKPA